MNKWKHFLKIKFLLACVLFIAPRTGFGALNDEIATISSSIQGDIMNNDAKIEDESQRLAGTYASDLIPFTKNNIRKVDRPNRCVLLRAITQLPDKPAVLDALYELAMSETGLVHEDVITAISFCDRDEIVNVALRLAKDTQSRQAGNSALALLKIFGNSAAVSSLSQLEKSVEDKQFKREIAAARKNIEDRMNSSSTVQQDWDRYALPYWRIPRAIPPVHNIMMRYFLQAELLNRRGYRFPGAFLKDRLQKNEPLAAALLAVQNESGFIEDLRLHLSDKSMLQEVCRRGIAHLEGTQTIDVSSYFK